MAEQRESYLLNRSEQFNLATGAENRTDLVLSPNPDVNKSVIAGDVLTGTTPVPNALVKILTLSGNPVDHQFTNASGRFASMQLPAGIYHVVATAPGFLTSEPVTVNLAATSAYLVIFSLSPDPRAAKNTIYGLILDQSTGNRISNATVILMDAQGQTVATTQADSDGEYLLCENDNGSYMITAEKPGYQLPTPLTVTVSGGQIAQTDIALQPEVVTEGTVQGFIKDQNGNLLAGACVSLYSVTDSTETLLQITRANENGFYLFGIVTAGNYLLKAKVDVIV